MKPIFNLIIVSLLLQSCNQMISNADSAITPSTTIFTTATKEATPISPPIITSSLNPNTIRVLYEGTFSFETTLGANYDNAVFDFDTNKPQSDDRNDMSINVSQGTNTFITASPLNGASVYPLKQDSELFSRVFNYSECHQGIDSFRTGSKPLNSGGYFCWKSNEGRLVEFTIQKIYKSVNENFIIDIKYIVWDKVVE